LNYDNDEDSSTNQNWYLSNTSGKETPRLNIPSGSTIVSPDTPTRTGYTFAGWYYANNTPTSALGKWNFDSNIVTETMVLFAKWTQDTPEPGPNPDPEPKPLPDDKPDPAPDTKPSPTKPANKTPNTGDTNNLSVWFILSLVALGTATIVVTTRTKKRRK
jgi:uncharacterized repeat protein (TIGR02543 family)/LPXTG-motif cell wall-anchored protein